MSDKETKEAKRPRSTHLNETKTCLGPWPVPTGSTLEACWVNSKILNLSIWEGTSYLETGKPLIPGIHSSWFPPEKYLPIGKCLRDNTGFPGGTSGKEPACQCRRHKVRQVSSLGWDDPLQEVLATHSSIFAWRIPWTEDLAGYSPWGHKEPDTTETMQHTQRQHSPALQVGLDFCRFGHTASTPPS